MKIHLIQRPKNSPRTGDRNGIFLVDYLERGVTIMAK
jgi:hypothetical protein